MSQADPTRLHSSPRIKTWWGRNSGKEKWVILLKEYSLLLSLWHEWLKVTKGEIDQLYWINSFMRWVVYNVRSPPRLSLMSLHRALMEAPVAAWNRAKKKKKTREEQRGWQEKWVPHHAVWLKPSACWESKTSRTISICSEGHRHRDGIAFILDSLC